MSHATCLVHCAKALTPEEAVEDAAELMWPYVEAGMIPDDEYETHPNMEELSDDKYGRYWNNPQSFWDWYSIGGRWRGFFIVGLSAEVLVGQPGAMDNDVQPVPKQLVTTHKRADVCRKQDIDEEAMGLAEVERMSSFYDLANSGERVWMDSEQLQDAHHMDKDAWIRKYLEGWAPYKLLDAEGHYGSKLGWFGTTVDEVDDWPSEFRTRWDKVPAEDFVVLIDYHV